MKEEMCREFQAWLDNLPLSPISPELEQHRDGCPECCHRYAFLSPVIEALMEAPPSEKLSGEKIKKFVKAAEKEYTRHSNRRSALKVGLHTLFGLPFVVVINWLWIKLGSSLLTNIFSPDVARVYLILSLIAVTLITALTLGSIPILWGRLREQPSKECLG